MSFRTVIISSHSKLEYSLNCLVFKTIDEVKRVNLDEIQTLIIESTAVSLTTALLSELIKKKIKVIFCDEKKNPISELTPYYGDSISYKRICEQINWNNALKNQIWKEIIKEKILKQAEFLSINFKAEAELLKDFAKEVEDGDITNREGHAAKLYFNRIYGSEFSRSNSHKNNIYLNYGYTLLLSQFNRCIVSKGYLTQIGIHHKNEFNQFNLSCDFMEPFRPLIDKKILELNERNFKDELVLFMSSYITIDGQKQTISNAINIYCISLFNALNQNNPKLIKFYTNDN